MSYRAIVEQENRQKYRMPEGWDTREQVAKDLGCSVDRVNQLLAPAIQSGRIKVQNFQVWNERLKQRVTVRGYQEVKVAAKPTPRK